MSAIGIFLPSAHRISALPAKRALSQRAIGRLDDVDGALGVRLGLLEGPYLGLKVLADHQA
jgi:hypothetical protein